MPEPNTEPQVRDVRSPIRPVLPAHMQAKLLGVIALVMVLVISFSGRKPLREPKPATAPAPAVIEPSQSRIQDYRTAIDEASRKLAAEEAELAHAKQAVAQESNLGGPTGVPLGMGANSNSAPVPQYRYEPDVGPIQAERAKREYQSLFASNIALSYRPANLAAGLGSTALREALAATWTQAPALPLSSSVEPVTPPAPLTKENRAVAGGYRLLEGTILETVLTNRLDSSFSGPVNCMVTTNVYSRDRVALLIPQGSRILGEARKVEGLGDQRLAVVYHRLIRPDGYSINLDRFLGLDQIGETGLRDQINHHYLQLFGASIAIGAIAGLAEANTRVGINASAADAYEQGISSSLSQSALHILDRFLNVLPTFTIREGQRIKIYLSQDLTIPLYEPMKGELP